MGFKQAAVLASVSFFLGVLFICFSVDHRVLWEELTDDVITDAFQFYTTFFNAPPAIKALLHGMIGVGLIGLISKLHVWDESAMFFDGSSLGCYVFSIVVYLAVIISSLRSVVNPVENVDTREDQIMALRVISAANVIIVLCLVFILVLQAGQEWAQRSVAKSMWKRGEATEEKKNQ